MVAEALAFVALAWVAFNALAPLAVLPGCVALSPARLPADILAAQPSVTRFWLADLQGRGAAYSLLGVGVVFDRAFFSTAPVPVVRFVLAHELAHHALGHLWLRWITAVLLLQRVPAVRRHLTRTEVEADNWAADVTHTSRRELFLQPNPS